MKAFLLAAGLGTRLKPLTNKLPKCLLPIGGKPLLYIWLDLLEYEGIEEVLINTHYLADMVESAVRKRKNKIRVTLTYESELLGSAGTILTNKAFVESEEDFFVLYADNLTNISLKEIYDFHKNVNSIFTTYVYETDIPAQKGIFLAEDNGKVIDFEEKPKIPKSNISNAGLGVFNKSIFNYTDIIGDGYDIGKDLMPKLIGKMYILKSNYYINDIGTLADYEKAQIDFYKINLKGIAI